MDISVVLSSGAFAMLVLEGVKQVLRKWVYKNPSYDFSKAFYVVAIPVLNILLTPLVGLIWDKPELFPTDVLSFVRLVIQTLLMSLVSLGSYVTAVKPLKTYVRTYLTKQ